MIIRFLGFGCYHKWKKQCWFIIIIYLFKCFLFEWQYFMFMINKWIFFRIELNLIYRVYVIKVRYFFHVSIYKINYVRFTIHLILLYNSSNFRNIFVIVIAINFTTETYYIDIRLPDRIAKFWTRSKLC